MSSRFTIVRFLLGSLLLAAAALKLYGLSVSAIPRVGWFSQPWVQMAAAEWELVLGLWLISGAYPRLSWLAALVTFATFAAISSRLGSLGVASCGCFGSIQASPWSAFLVDAVALVLLIRVRPPMRATGHEVRPALTKGMKWAGGVGLGAVLILAGLALLGVAKFGSLSASLALLLDESLEVPSYVDFGDGRPGEKIGKQVPVSNWTGKTIRLVGGTSDCSCLATEDLPVSIPSGETRWVQIVLKVPAANAGQFTRVVILRTDLDSRQTVQIRVGCRVVQ